MLGISGVHLAVEGKGTADTPPSSGTRRFKERSNRPASYHILGRTDPSLSAAGKTLLSSTSYKLTEPTPKSTQAPGSARCLPISRASGCSPAQRVPLLFVGKRVAALRIPELKALSGGASLDPLPTIPALPRPPPPAHGSPTVPSLLGSTHFSPVPPLSTPSPPPPHSASEASQLRGG